jgi:YggT family protein
MTGMALLWGVVGYVLYVYLVLLLARFIVDWTRQFARSWRPVGVTAIGVEFVYMATDPPIRLLRKWIPPLRLGSVSLDLSVIILLIVLIVVRQVVLTIG